MSMYREKIRTIGISLLGANSGVEGAYELNIDSIRAVNVEDVTDWSGAPVYLRRPTDTVAHVQACI